MGREVVRFLYNSSYIHTHEINIHSTIYFRLHSNFHAKGNTSHGYD